MSTKKPAYLTLYESLREEIISGIRPYGSRLPSRRILARDRGVSAITAEHSIELLCEEGYAESRPRSGCYVIYRETDGFTLPSVRAEHRFPSVPPTPDRDTFPFPALARVMRRVLTEYGEEIMVRSPNTGCPILRETLCSYLARNRGIRVQPDQIIIGAGAEYLYNIFPSYSFHIMNNVKSSTFLLKNNYSRKLFFKQIINFLHTTSHQNHYLQMNSISILPHKL